MKRGTVDDRPQNRQSLDRDLAAIGVEPNMTLMVHSSLSAIGWVVGGAPIVVQAMFDVLGDRGTLVMPAATPHCADPASWEDPVVAESWLEEVREHLPVFDPSTTPTTMGAIAECFRTWPGTLRSDHPLGSVSANGPQAEEIVAEHALELSEGPGTPFERLHELDAWILLLGVGFNRCTALHFAESRAERRRLTNVRLPALEDGRRVWIEIPEMATDDSTHFPIVGEQFEAAGKVQRGAIGQAESMLFGTQDLVSFASEYFERTL